MSDEFQNYMYRKSMRYSKHFIKQRSELQIGIRKITISISIPVN